MISHYSFGSLTYQDKTFTKDLIILKSSSQEKILSHWWRKEGHYLQVEDLEEVFSFKPQYLIVGTGASGVMRIDPKVVERAKALGIVFEAYPTEKAVKRFNELLKEKVSLAGAFHLTC
ncbi:hypothetical protein THC_1068 [Caldimicrobium thiodismutans]|uniref:Uncharacterized protein n=1 Tax=Caldimicrobium thiodismutans TaxID=1653476 RepID=A0A0U5AVY1_9BACT|nr:MTH938/NDUFAF3 family protein [Caldimicrobium thiodismutans]BAU23448.1 hypothetical protein THC_1068 [Caldimicrobium thiodismutans]